jgi:RNA polymerase sigma-70 factor (ECF subfamily)
MLADDLVQETLKKALLKQHQLKEFSRLEAWLCRILHNCWMEYLRAKKPAVDIDDVNMHHDETPDKELTEQQIIERVRQAIIMLPLTQRQVITLVDLEGSRYEEVSEILDIPLGTVMSRLSRARIMLKERLIGMQNIRTAHARSSSQNHLRSVK